MKKYKPLANRVLVKPLDDLRETKGGVKLTEASAIKRNLAEVIDVGPGRMLENGERTEMSVKRGDTVLFTGQGLIINIDDVVYRMFDEDSLVAIFEGDLDG